MFTSLIRLFPGQSNVEFEVQLHAVAVSELNRLGKEVVVNWELKDFDNDLTFYTDSNGLEM